MNKFRFTAVVLVVLLLMVMPSMAQDKTPTLHIRVAHFAPDAPAVDIYLNGKKSPVQKLAFSTVSDWLEVAEGKYQIAVVPTGETKPVIGPAAFDLKADSWLTIAAVGSVSRKTLKAAVVAEDYTPLEDGKVRIAVFHGIEGLAPVDVYANGSKIVNLLAFPGAMGSNDGTAILNVPTGRYDLAVNLNGEAKKSILKLSNAIFVAKNNYLVAVVGTKEAPQIVTVATNR